MSIRFTVKKLVCAIGVTALSLSPVVLTSAAISLISADAAEANNGKGGGNGRSNDRGGRDNDRANRGQTRGNAPAARPVQAAPQASRPAVAVPVEGSDVVEGPRNHGAIASELKGLNAANANPNAFANASPNSQVGRIAAYQTAALANLEAGTAVETATDALVSAQGALGAQIDSYAGRSSDDIQADIALLDPAATDYQDQLAALNGELDAALTQETVISGLIDDVFNAELTLADAELAAAAAKTTEEEAFLVASDGRTLSDAAMAYFRELLELPAIPDETEEIVEATN